MSLSRKRFLIGALAPLLIGCGGDHPAAPSATMPSATMAPATMPSASSLPDQSPVLADNTVVHADVPYGGPDPTLDVVDIYSPREAKDAPILLYVHGGEWSRGDKREIAFKPRLCNTHGIVLACINYRLSPKAPHPAQVDDIVTAISFLREHGKDYGGNPEKIVLMGHSAGCHMVSLVALDPEYLAKRNLKQSDLRGVVAWSGGMYDLVDRYKAGGTYHSFIESTFGASPEAQRAGSPITYVKNAAGAPPFLLISVDDEKSKSSRAATENFGQMLMSNGGKVQQELLTGKTHFTSDYDLGAPGDKTSEILLKFIDGTTAHVCDD